MPQPTTQSALAPTAVVLSIAGSDNGAGAGIQADIKTGAAFGVYVATAVTAITVQGGGAPVAVYPVTRAQLSAQIRRVLDHMPVKAIKLGMLATPELLDCVAEILGDVSLPVVIDPVWSASAGGALLTAHSAAEHYRRLLPLARVFTPNVVEAAAILELSVAHNEAEMKAQAQALAALGANAVLIKGGHAQLRLAADFLYFDQQIYPYSSPWLQTLHTHGTGCTLATAIAAGLAQGMPVPQAVAAAKTYIQGAIEGAERLQLAAAGGPLHHFYQQW